MTIRSTRPEEETAPPVMIDQQTPSTRSSRQEEFTELSERVRGDGLLGRRGGYYAIKVPATLGALTSLLVAALLIGVILIVGGLTFFPALALGPIVEHFALAAGTLY